MRDLLGSLPEQIKGRWREFRREPSAFFFVIFMPILWLVLLGPAFSGKGTDVYGVGWLEHADTDARGATVAAALASAPGLRLSRGDEATMTRALKRGDVTVVVDWRADGPTYRFDPTARAARATRAVVDDAVQRALGRVDVLAPREDALELPGSRYVDFLVPGLIALTIMTTSLYGTGMTIVVNRRENLLKRYLATPMRPLDYILSHIAGRYLMLVAEMTAVLVAATLLFRFRIEGNFGAFIVFAMLGAASLTSLGILLASRTANSGLMNGLANLVNLPLVMVGGVFFSRGNFPEWLAKAASYLPLTPLVDGLRRIALEGATLGSLTKEIALLAAYLVACTVASKALFRWY
jgi:ABC-type multidrug transport system permease subunit